MEEGAEVDSQMPGVEKPSGDPGLQTRLTCVVGQATRLAVEAEPTLLPGLDAATHLHQGPSAATAGHAHMRTAFWVVAPAFQVLAEIQDTGSWQAGWGRRWGLQSAETRPMSWELGVVRCCSLEPRREPGL